MKLSGTVLSTADFAQSTHDANRRPLDGNELLEISTEPFNASATASGSQQPPNCNASEASDAAALMLAAVSSAPEPRRFSSPSDAPSSHRVDMSLARRRRSRSGGDDGDRGSTELVVQLRNLCRRQRQRSEERAFVRDIECVLNMLKAQTPASDGGEETSATSPGPVLVSMDEKALRSVREKIEATGSCHCSAATLHSSTYRNCKPISSSDGLQETLSLAEIDALLDCIADLFNHQNYSVRALAFEVVQLCLQRFGERLTLSLRRKVYLRLETHSRGDFLLRQKALRALTQDGRHLEPFQVELGWFLLQLLEQSDAQRHLLGLIQNILRRSPRMLDRDKVIAIVALISVRCEIAWSRNDLDACRRFVAFYHVLAVQDLAFATSTLACLRSLCCIVNADGHGTWSVMKHLLNGSSGFLVLRGILQVLDHPITVTSVWVLRGAVFFVGMSCWGSQRVAKFDDLAWAPILLGLEKALQCCRGVVIFEVILSIQRLIKKFGALHPAVNSGHKPSMLTTAMALPRVGDHCRDTTRPAEQRRLITEWDIILRMLQTLRPWVSMTDEDKIGGASHQVMQPENRQLHHQVPRPSSYDPATTFPDQLQQQLSISIQQTRIPRELLDTLRAVEDLVDNEQFAGDEDEFLSVLEDYLPHLSEQSMLFLLQQRANAAQPGYHLYWLSTLSAVMRTYFSCRTPNGDLLPMPITVRLEALEVLRRNLWTSRNVCEDRVIEEVVIPTLGRIYEDPDAEVRRHALDFIIEVAHHLESINFDSLLDILASAMTLSITEDTQLVAARGIVTLFSSAFDHLPPARAVRMYDLIATTVEIHRSRAVRHAALSCLLCVCEARASDGKLKWKERQQVRTSRFLYVSRRATRTNATNVQLPATCVPVARALRALLNIVSVESDAEIFRMAVKGIKTMLENRAILEDVDVSEVSTKVVLSIDYRTFGRAAIPDEVDTLLNKSRNDERFRKHAAGLNARHLKCNDGDTRASYAIPQTDAEFRSIHASTRSLRTCGMEDTEESFCANVRAIAALLTKTRFLAMGVELLQLLSSYEAALHDTAVQELTKCLLGAMKIRLIVAEKDLFASGSAGDDCILSTTASSPNLLFQPQKNAALIGGRDLYASGPRLGFTSRVMSQFQTSTSHNNLLHSLSRSVSKTSLASSPAQPNTIRHSPRNDRGQLQDFVRQLFEAEFKLLHAAATTLSLLALLSSNCVRQLDQALESLLACVTTVDGDFRPDACKALLELLSTIVPIMPCDPGVNLQPAFKVILEALLLGFEHAKSKQLSCLAFRLLCQIVQHSDRKSRLSLATLAMPTLRQCTRRANRLLAEAAVEYLMCYAYTQSPLTPPTLGRWQQRQHEQNDTATVSQTKSRSWVYERSLLTMTTTLRGAASLVIHRANCTSRWELSPCFDLSHELESSSLHFHHKGQYKASDIFQTRNSDTVALQSGVRNTDGKKQRSLSNELRPYHIGRLTLSSSTNARFKPDDNRNIRSNNSYLGAEVEEVNSTYQITIDTFQHASALPPLPAYDGIGGSPSYFCDNAPVRRSVPRNLRRPASSTHSKQSKGDSGQRRPPLESAICAIRAIEEEIEDDGSDMDEFTLNDDLDEPLHFPAQASRVVHFPGYDDQLSSRLAASQGTIRSRAFSTDDQCDPTYFMMQLFDLTAENRPKLLCDGPSLKLALAVLNRTPEYETHKIGLLYVRDKLQSSETAILENVGGSLRYLRFLRGLGTFTKLQNLVGYSGGLDTTSNSDGKFGLIYQDACTQIMFHVATMMISQSDRPAGSAVDGFSSMKKKRHIGNDFVHVVFKEFDEDYNLQTLSGQFNDVHIVIQPIHDREYRTEVHVKAGISPFGPLYGKQIISSSIISKSVRLTCLNANLACRAFHQDLVGFSLNCEERLKQIKQLGVRLATTDEWNFE